LKTKEVAKPLDLEEKISASPGLLKELEGSQRILFPEIEPFFPMGDVTSSGMYTKKTQTWPAFLFLFCGQWGTSMLDTQRCQAFGEVKSSRSSKVTRVAVLNASEPWLCQGKHMIFPVEFFPLAWPFIAFGLKKLSSAGPAIVQPFTFNF